MWEIKSILLDLRDETSMRLSNKLLSYFIGSSFTKQFSCLVYITEIWIPLVTAVTVGSGIGGINQGSLNTAVERPYRP